ncbi:hypothetical protein SAMN05421856_104157 [Chryseobacterium taichungense]|uniref:Uncharacterized protein n=1 Tax=Chryseobacterium taichungense TaxID=295069 RepID=A0A1H7ZDI9_9FLAO|nr:hypothetical protein SAMN05421856_104157 [Chryseobacterium taichungense]
MLIGIVYKTVLFLTLIQSYISGRKYSFSAQNYLFLYLLITFTNECISFVRNIINPNVKVGLQYNVYFVFCILFFTFYFFKLFSKIIKKVLIVISIFSLGYIFSTTNFLSQDFDHKIGITVTLFYIVISLLWFYHKITFFDERKISDDPAFWISTALMMWSCFFLFRVTPMFYFAKEDEEFLKFLKLGQNIINIGMYIMFYISLLKYKSLSHESY